MDGARQSCWFLVGPTACGKNSGAIPLAEQLGAEIIVLDSMKVFRGMDIGTAKPTPAQRAAVPHHGLDLAAPSERFDVERYLQHVDGVLAELDRRGVPALFVGGTHLYLQALVRGVFRGPPPDAAIRAAHAQRPAPELHAELSEVDPATAARLHPNDHKRISRALEVFELTSRPLSELQAAETQPRLDRSYRGLVACRQRDELYDRIDRRVEQMLSQPWLEEIARIEASGGFGPQAAQAIGYRELRQALADGADPRAPEVAQRIQTKTHNLARKQANWLGRFTELERVELSGCDGPQAARRILEASARCRLRQPTGGRWLRGGY